MTTAYLLGAGFSRTANAYFRPADEGICGPYPLGDELVGLCFDSSYNTSLGVEAAFQEAIGRSDNQPIARLVDAIQSADHCPGRRAADDPSSNLYQFLTDLPAETYLTFNYDGLVEQGLMRLGRWAPTDGFGVPAVTAYPSAIGRLSERSSAVVVHLHGSLYLYPREFDVSSPDSFGTEWLTIKDKVAFVFDPDTNVDLFLPFTKGEQGLLYSRPDRRFIAPVPNKASGLAGAYVRAAYDAALKRLHDVEHLVAIGYRFGLTDRQSYDALLRVIAGVGGKLTVVAPDAAVTAAQLSFDYECGIVPIPQTFDQWVSAGYPGVRAV
ncbi:MAG: hypothetical protein NPIRA03_01150 [Nitrospirales bacterium]|nr:MAG: hypothetical protein NPIRA03_01150 [Nitrospirales bacterium]